MFEWGHPYAFLLMPLPLLIWYALPKAPLHLSGALKVPFFNQLSMTLNVEFTKRLKRQLSLLSLIWILLITAFASPRYVGAPIPVHEEGYNIMMVLDISGSMGFEDMLYKDQPTSRLEVVKHAAGAFVKDRAFDKIGLILFATRAHLLTPLTFDKKNIIDRLNDATLGLAGKSTSIGDALGLAIRRLSNVPPQGRVIILLTDGGNNSGALEPMQAAEIARDEGIKIYTIGLGANAQVQMGIGGLTLGINPSTDLDENTLKKIANETGGRYFRATESSSLLQVYKTINALEPISQEDRSRRPQFEYYPWPLALAFLLLIYWLVDVSGLLSYRFLKPETENTRP